PDERPATDLRAGRGDVESERIGLAGGDARLALSRAQAPAGAGIDLPLEAVRGMAGGGDLRLDLSARAEAGIEQAALLQCFERGGVVAEMLRLDPHRLLPAQAQPGEVLEDRGGVFRAAARDVDILDAQQETTAGFSGARMGDPCRIGMAEMQIAGRAWRETCDDVRLHGNPTAA